MLNDNFPLSWFFFKFFREGGPYRKRNNLKLIIEHKFLHEQSFFQAFLENIEVEGGPKQHKNTSIQHVFKVHLGLPYFLD